MYHKVGSDQPQADSHQHLHGEAGMGMLLGSGKTSSRSFYSSELMEVSGPISTQFLLNVTFESRQTSPSSKGSKDKSVVLNTQVKTRGC